MNIKRLQTHLSCDVLFILFGLLFLYLGIENRHWIPIGTIYTIFGGVWFVGDYQEYKEIKRGRD